MAKRRIFNKIKNSKLLELLDNSYIGTVEEIDDPEFLGRCRIRVYGVFGDKNDSLGKIPVEDLPWAYPFYELGFGSKDGSGRFSTPKKDAVVRVIFEGDLYHPRYFGIEELDKQLKSAIKDDYTNFHSLLFDTDENMKIYYAKKTGFFINLKDSTINIEPGGAIVLNHKQSTASIDIRGNDIDIVTKNAVNVSSNNTITLNSNMVHANGAETRLGANPIYSNMNGEQAMILLSILAAAIDAKTPNTPGQFSGIVQQMKELILSKTVKTTP